MDDSDEEIAGGLERLDRDSSTTLEDVDDGHGLRRGSPCHPIEALLLVPPELSSALCSVQDDRSRGAIELVLEMSS